MEISTSDLQAQLNTIVNSAQPAAVPVRKAETPAPEVKSAAPTLKEIEIQEYRAAVSSGNEVEFLESRAVAMNGFFEDMSVDISYKIEKADVGGYVVSIVDDNGKVIKTIPGETFIQTRAKIRDELKGLIEDNNT
jgi:uncharacterized FlaG/YvyC family protein